MNSALVKLNFPTASQARLFLCRVWGGALCCSLVGIALLLTLGCGPKSDLLEVSGEVSLNGAALKSGSIRLTSMGGEKASSTGAMIRDGNFEIPQSKGLLPGQYQVVISAGDESAPQDAGGPGGSLARELIPAEYNVNSDKTVEVTVDGENHFVFDIKSK